MTNSVTMLIINKLLCVSMLFASETTSAQGVAHTLNYSNSRHIGQEATACKRLCTKEEGCAHAMMDSTEQPAGLIHANKGLSLAPRRDKHMKKANNIREFNRQADTENLTELTLNKAKVVCIRESWAFVRDETGCVAFKFDNKVPLQTGDVLSGFVRGTFFRNRFPALLVENNATDHVMAEHKPATTAPEIDCTTLSEGDCFYGYQPNVAVMAEKDKKNKLKLTLDERTLKMLNVFGLTYNLPKYEVYHALTGLFDIKEGEIRFIPLEENAFRRAFVLDEKKPANKILRTNATAVVVKRKIKAQRWNTICLPFDMSTEQLQEAFGTHCLMAFTAAENNKLTFKPTTKLVAGVPYLLKTATEIKAWTMQNVNVVAQNAGLVSHNGVAFCGTFHHKVLAEDNSEQFLMGNKLFLPANNARTLPGLRAYFKFTSAAAAKQFEFVADEATGIAKNVEEAMPLQNDVWYTLEGKKMEGQKLQRGQVYVHRNKKILVR